MSMQLNDIRISLEQMLSTLPDSDAVAKVVLDKIKENKYPFECVKGEDGRWKIQDQRSEGDIWLDKFITVRCKQLKEDAKKMMNVPDEVLVLGETGTGKDILAKAMIGNRKGLICSLNCSAVPETLMESILFGYVKGAFTGADKDKEGLMHTAKDGVMFMDEIGNLPLHMQSKLLLAIETKRIRRVGSNSEESITCRFVCATNKPLRKMAREGKFLVDLLARISTLELFIPPLRDRIEDLEGITLSMDGGKEFWAKHGEDLKNGNLDLMYNARSIRQHVRRYKVLGRVLVGKPYGEEE